RDVMDRLGARELTIAYGLTEASPVLTQTCTDDPLQLRTQTVGQPLPGVEIRIVDPQSGAVLDTGQQGELCSRGHGTMIGYYNDDEATARAIDEEGWLHSGDLAVREPNGYFRITGRIKDMVIRGGENIFPREIEEFLFGHPDIEDVSVVGVPDDRYGEELCAWIKLQQGSTSREKDIRVYCQQNISHQKVPKYIRLVQEFPLTVTGKIQKFKIREAMVQELGLVERSPARSSPSGAATD
ncbi:MAG: AMP-binding protein, partial [Pirellulaceae bacterium]